MNRGDIVRLIDLTGKEYHSWKILERAENDKNGLTRWLCQCKCGKKNIFRSTEITLKHAKKDCGCSKSWVGKKFGRLTVLEKVSGKGNHAAKILCRCDCGVEKIVWGGSLHQGTVKSCGCIKSVTEEYRCITKFMSHYNRQSKARNKEFSLNRDQFESLIKSDCYYCGEKESNTTKIKTKYSGDLLFRHNGIDRVNNHIGYTINNCVPCCGLCNRMKRDLSVDDWKNHMEKILLNLDNREKALTG